MVATLPERTHSRRGDETKTAGSRGGVFGMQSSNRIEARGLCAPAPVSPSLTAVVSDMLIEIARPIADGLVGLLRREGRPLHVFN